MQMAWSILSTVGGALLLASCTAGTVDAGEVTASDSKASPTTAGPTQVAAPSPASAPVDTNLSYGGELEQGGWLRGQAPDGALSARLDGQELDSDAREVIAALEAVPSHAIVVGDEPSLLYAAGRASPPWLTDTSFARIRAGYLNESDVVDALAMPETCALLIWSGRFRELAPDLAETAARLGYTDRIDYDPGHTLLRRATCDE